MPRAPGQSVGQSFLIERFFVQSKGLDLGAQFWVLQKMQHGFGTALLSRPQVPATDEEGTGYRIEPPVDLHHRQQRMWARYGQVVLIAPWMFCCHMQEYVVQDFVGDCLQDCDRPRLNLCHTWPISLDFITFIHDKCEGVAYMKDRYGKLLKYLGR